MLGIALAVQFDGGRAVAAGPAPGEREVRFVGLAGEPLDTVPVGDIVAVFVRDDALGTTGLATASWADVSEDVPAGVWWGLADGSPFPAGYSLSGAGGFDSARPSLTPIGLGADPWNALVDGIPNGIVNFNPATAQVKLVADVDAGSAVEIAFTFEAVDVYPAGDRMVHVSTGSDPAGEWISLAEVAGLSDRSPAGATGLFFGEVLLSPDPAHAGEGDGVVWVRPGDVVRAAYFDADPAMLIDQHFVVAAALAATPVPAAGAVALAAGAAVLALFVAVVRRLSGEQAQVRLSPGSPGPTS